MKTTIAPLLALFFGLVSSLPAQGQGLFMNPLEERRIGVAGHPTAIANDGGEISNKTVAVYIEKIGQEAANASARHPDQFVFTTLHNSSFNAYARPGGFLYVHAGIIPWLNDEAELMALMGHEVGHAISRHSARSYNRESVADRLLDLSSRRRSQSSEELEDKKIQSWLALQEYGRDQEYESDDIALSILTATKRDPQGSPRMLYKLVRYGAIMEALSGEPDETPDYARSHPPSSDRVRRALSKMQEAGLSETSSLAYRDRFLDTIDGLIVPGSILTNKKPYRVRVVKVSASDTIASLSARMQVLPGLEDIIFRTVNNISDNETTLPVGYRVKVFEPV
jgi:predicted Zn-dependent protease